jgi:NADH:ubiquinone oxidoreductase subunit K
MFNTSFITLFGFAFATLAVTTSLWPEVPTHMIIMIAAAPVVVVVSALTAYFRGEFKSWWAYEET